MSPARLAIRLALLALVLAAMAAPGASASPGISSARALGGGTIKSSRVNSGNPKPQLFVATQTPAGGATVSGAIPWQVSVTGAVATRVEFAVDGSVKWTDTAAPYEYGGTNGALDTTKLSNGSHILSATAYGAKGTRAGTAGVTVNVANVSAEPAPEPTPEPKPEPTPEPEPAPSPSSSILWGATIGSQITGSQAPWDMTAVTKFEEMTKKPASMVQFFQPFANCGSSGCSFYPFPTTPLENVRKHGAIPVLSWSSQSIPSSLNEPDFQLSDVIEGRYDEYIRSFATSAKNWGHPFFLRFDWEMNGNWFPWSEGVNGNKTGEFVAAWRHVHEIFTAVGATNATWVWCPNVDWNSDLQGLAAEYPGDAYVDWTGLDGYNWGTNPNRPGSWKTFDQIYRSTYRYIAETVAPSKPLMIGEVASSEYGGSKATWIKEMLSKVPTEYRKIRALLWFDKFDSSMDWPIETSSSATSAFAEGIQNSTYTGNTFGGLSGGAIQPPG
ncbi:MAG TPA: glycosyl hydrolase [Solirubrobacterales bacterium]|jgi:hypothetical protein